MNSAHSPSFIYTTIRRKPFTPDQHRHRNAFRVQAYQWLKSPHTGQTTIQRAMLNMHLHDAIPKIPLPRDSRLLGEEPAHSRRGNEATSAPIKDTKDDQGSQNGSAKQQAEGQEEATNTTVSCLLRENAHLLEGWLVVPTRGHDIIYHPGYDACVTAYNICNTWRYFLQHHVFDYIYLGDNFDDVFLHIQMWDCGMEEGLVVAVVDHNREEAEVVLEGALAEAGII